MSNANLRRRVANLEAAKRAKQPPANFFFRTVADAGDDAEHERQLAEQMAAHGCTDRDMIVHVRTGIVHPPWDWQRGTDITGGDAVVHSAPVLLRVRVPTIEPRTVEENRAEPAETALRAETPRKRLAPVLDGGAFPLPHPPIR